MLSGPFPDQPLRHSGAKVAGEELPIEIEGRLLPLMLGMKVGWPVLPVEHPDDDGTTFGA
jgi:hypothetical protein